MIASKKNKQKKMEIVSSDAHLNQLNNNLKQHFNRNTATIHYVTTVTKNTKGTLTIWNMNLFLGPGVL